MSDRALRLAFERAEWLVLISELEWASAETERVLAEADRVVAEIRASREQREHDRLRLGEVVVGADGRARWS